MRIGKYAVLALVLMVAACAKTPAERKPARHVILISMDTARADHFGFLGSREGYTPRLDSLARESIVFADCMTVVPTTLASHTSLFTGKYPHHHGVPRNGFMVNQANEMLPEILKGAGFHTAGFAGSFSLDSRFDFAQGFDHYDQEFDVLVGQGGADQNQRPAAGVTDAVIRYLDETGVPPRMFLFVHYFDPHLPYAAPPPFDRAYDPQGAAGLPPLDALKLSPSLSPAERERYAHRYALQYAAEISYMDHHLGRLVDALRDRGILEEAILVVTSDHGECLWDHVDERFDHGSTVYQATMWAVWLMRLPGAELGGTRVGGLVASIDVLPTLLHSLGLSIPAGMDGEPIDLRTIGSSLSPRTRYGEATKPWQQVETDPRWTNMRKARCVREGGFKFVQTPYLATQALYDVTSDPGETSDLLADPSPETMVLAARLQRDLETWAASAKPLPSRFEPSQREETIARLRSLGYLQ